MVTATRWWPGADGFRPSLDEPTPGVTCSSVQSTAWPVRTPPARGGLLKCLMERFGQVPPLLGNADSVSPRYDEPKQRPGECFCTFTIRSRASHFLPLQPERVLEALLLIMSLREWSDPDDR